MNSDAVEPRGIQQPGGIEHNAQSVVRERDAAANEGSVRRTQRHRADGYGVRGHLLREAHDNGGITRDIGRAIAREDFCDCRRHAIANDDGTQRRVATVARSVLCERRDTERAARCRARRDIDVKGLIDVLRGGRDGDRSRVRYRAAERDAHCSERAVVRGAHHDVQRVRRRHDVAFGWRNHRDQWRAEVAGVKHEDRAGANVTLGISRARRDVDRAANRQVRRDWRVEELGHVRARDLMGDRRGPGHRQRRAPNARAIGRSHAEVHGRARLHRRAAIRRGDGHGRALNIGKREAELTRGAIAGRILSGRGERDRRVRRVRRDRHAERHRRGRRRRCNVLTQLDADRRRRQLDSAHAAVVGGAQEHRDGVTRDQLRAGDRRDEIHRGCVELADGHFDAIAERHLT